MSRIYYRGARAAIVCYGKTTSFLITLQRAFRCRNAASSGRAGYYMCNNGLLQFASCVHANASMAVLFQIFMSVLVFAVYLHCSLVQWINKSKSSTLSVALSYILGEFLC